MANGDSRKGRKKHWRMWVFEKPPTSHSQHSQYRYQSNQWFINHRVNYRDRENKEKGRREWEETGRDRHGRKIHEPRGGRGWYHEESVGIDGARKKGRKERKRETERALFVWKEDLKHVVPLYTRIEARKNKKKKTVYWKNGDSGRVGWCAGSRKKNDVLRETRNRDEEGWTEDKGE